MGTEFITEREVWDPFVQQSPYGTFFHRWDFLKAVERHSGARLLPLAIRKGEALVWAVPLFLSRKFGVRVLTAMPPNSAIPYLGPVPGAGFDGLGQYRKESHLSLLSEGIRELVLEHRPHFTLLSTSPGFTDIRPFLWEGYGAGVNFTYVLDLTRSLDEIWRALTSRKRVGIARAQKMGYSVQVSTDTLPIYTMGRQRYAEQGRALPLLSARYLADLQRTFPEDLTVHHLLRDGAVEGGMVSLRDRRVRAWLGTTRTADHGNELLYWSVIASAKAAGALSFELVGANTPNINRFKSGFDPRLETYFSLTRRNTVGRVAEGLYRLVRS